MTTYPLILRRRESAWTVEETENEARAEWRELFGCVEIPTPFTELAAESDVVAAIAERNPGREIVVDEGGRGRIVREAEHTGAEKLSVQQFHGRYTIAARKRAKMENDVPSNGREAIRKVLFELAGELSRAETKGDVIQALGGLERYVDRVMKAAS